MKNFLSFLTLFIALLITGSSMAADTVAKINFTKEGGDLDQEGWTSVYGTKTTYPLDLGNGMTLVKVDGALPHLGDTDVSDIGAAPEGFPANVQNSANYLANTAEAYTIGFKITDLDPDATYTFDVYSRGWGTDGEKIVKFSVVEGDTVTMNCVLNEEIVTFEDLQPNDEGELTLSVTKLPTGYAFINGLIVTKEETVVTPPVMTGDTVAKINFTKEGGEYEQEGWSSVYGTKTTYPLDLGNGMTLVKIDGIYPHLGDTNIDDIGAEPEGFPANVQNSANYLANTDEAYTIGFKITGLDPAEKYKFDIYSRAWGTTEKYTKFSVMEDDTITLMNTLNEEVIYFEDLQPDANGELTLSVTKLPAGYAFINGLIVTKEETVVTPPVMTGDTVAKINFCHRDGDLDQEGWTSVYGTESTFPIDLGNGHSLVKVDGLYPHLGDTKLDDIGVELEGFPANVVNSGNYFANVAPSYTLGFQITGLDPDEKYTFEVYARGWASQDIITKFSVVEGDTIEVSTKDNEESIKFTDLSPNSNGEITLSVTKLPNEYAYISAFIVTKQETVVTPPVMTGDTVAKINFTKEGGDLDQEGWTSIYGTKTTFPIDLGNGRTLVKVDGLYPHLGDTDLADIGVELEGFPANVVNSGNYFANVAESYTLGFQITGLDPDEKYTFEVYARGWASQDIITKFSVVEGDTIEVSTKDNEESIKFTGVSPNSNGEITLSVTKLPNEYAYISAFIVTKDISDKVNDLDLSNIYLYPNPVNNTLNINGLPSNSVVSVFNIAGQKMIDLTNGNQSNMKADIGMLRNGIYLIRISHANKVVKSVKLIKK